MACRTRALPTACLVLPLLFSRPITGNMPVPMTSNTAKPPLGTTVTAPQGGPTTTGLRSMSRERPDANSSTVRTSKGKSQKAVSVDPIVLHPSISSSSEDFGVDSSSNNLSNGFGALSTVEVCEEACGPLDAGDIPTASPHKEQFTSSSRFPYAPGHPNTTWGSSSSSMMGPARVTYLSNSNECPKQGSKPPLP